MAALLFQQDDGGRSASGRRGEAGDCVARAVAIATARDYAEVYDELAELNLAYGGKRSAREGIKPAAIRDYLTRHLGWVWTPTMSIGSGCQVHLTDELYGHAFGSPEIIEGTRFVVRLSGHLTAVVDGVIHDTYDSAREGTRCVYGYWQPAR